MCRVVGGHPFGFNEERSMLRGFRIVLRGLSDTLENLLSFVLYSVCWWLCFFTIVLGPGATVALFTATDPRTASTLDRLSIRGFFGETRRRIGSGWKLALVTVPLLLILVHNLWFYQGMQDDLSYLAPAWIMLLVFGTFVTLTAFSVMALFDESWKGAMRISAILTGGRIFQMIGAGILLWLLILIGRFLIVPIFILLPATIAVVFNRLALTGLNIPINDPLAPTDERRAEEAGKKKRRWFGP